MNHRSLHLKTGKAEIIVPLNLQLFVNEVALEVLDHSKSLDLFFSKNLGHLGIRVDELLVLLVLQLLVLDVGPEPLHHLGPAALLILGAAHDVCKGRGEPERFVESSFLDHRDVELSL